MSENNASPFARRYFLTQVGAGMTVLGGVAAASAAPAGPQSAPTAPWQAARHQVDDWMELPGQHRFVFDTTEPAGMGNALLYAGNYFTANGTGYNLKDSDLGVIIVARHRSTPLAYNDAIWEKYGTPISAQMGNFVDPRTQEVPKTNVNMRQISGLIQRGAHFAVCQMATTAYAGAIARATGANRDDIFKELSENLVPNGHLVPAGIVAVNRAQERGYSFVVAV